MNRKIVQEILGNDYCFVDKDAIEYLNEPEHVKSGIRKQIEVYYDWFIYLRVKKYSYAPGSIIIAKNKSNRGGCVDCYDEFKPMLKQLERAMKYKRILK